VLNALGAKVSIVDRRRFAGDDGGWAAGYGKVSSCFSAVSDGANRKARSAAVTVTDHYHDWLQRQGPAASVALGESGLAPRTRGARRLPTGSVCFGIGRVVRAASGDAPQKRI
jgi:hypothetical protein